MFNAANGMSSAILSYPPYEWGTEDVGLSYVSPIIVCVPSTLAVGWLGDKLTVIMARRNNGISEPEHKLLTLIPLTILVPGGLLMMGLGPYYGAHWIVYVIGQGLVIGTGPMGALIPITYVFDSFHSIKPTKVRDSLYETEQSGAPYLIAMLLPIMCATFGVVSSLALLFFKSFARALTDSQRVRC